MHGEAVLNRVRLARFGAFFLFFSPRVQGGDGHDDDDDGTASSSKQQQQQQQQSQMPEQLIGDSKQDVHRYITWVYKTKSMLIFST